MVKQEKMKIKFLIWKAYTNKILDKNLFHDGNNIFYSLSYLIFNNPKNHHKIWQLIFDYIENSNEFNIFNKCSCWKMKKMFFNILLMNVKN